MLSPERRAAIEADARAYKNYTHGGGGIHDMIHELLNESDFWRHKVDALIASLYTELDDAARARVMATARRLEGER